MSKTSSWCRIFSASKASATASGPKSHQLVAIYFDTPDLRLAARASPCGAAAAVTTPAGT